MPTSSDDVGEGPRIEDAVALMDAFMDYCRVVGKPIIERGLFA